MLAHQLPDVVLYFKAGMDNRPVVSRSDECKKCEEIFQAFAAKLVSQPRPRALLLFRRNEEHGRSGEYQVFQFAARRRPFDRLLYGVEACVNRFEVPGPRCGASQEMNGLIDRLHIGGEIAG